MGEYKDISRILAYSIVVFLVFYFASFIVSIAFFKNVVFAIFGSIFVSFIFVIIFFYLSDSICVGWLYTDEKFTRNHVFGLLFAFFCLAYAIISYSVFVIYSTEIGIWLYVCLGLIFAFIRLCGKAKRNPENSTDE